ncbi:MAG: alpha-ketoglutarate-dependent dioxygenase AlkB [Bacteroidetes bacterium]|nr:MAG: alpha-ketoglutarate-dependent dioxygenase AlkB [Bacteroidota bacterium]TAG95700.1 MAG: alpha-ketoglutarate-dependent dioxygenase AlkB [Bacteroidota bacterium]
MENINGLVYIDDFITEIEQDNLINWIDNLNWLDDLKRRVQHYGYKYDYKKRKIDASMKVEKLPIWAENIAQKIVDQKLMPYLPDQLIINEYEAGQGISAHIDCEPCFEDTILSLSLMSGCVMNFIQKNDKNIIFPVYLKPKSIVVLSAEARYEWLHEIKPKKTDEYQNQKISRSRRISLTFRKVVLT